MVEYTSDISESGSQSRAPTVGANWLTGQNSRWPAADHYQIGYYYLSTHNRKTLILLDYELILNYSLLKREPYTATISTK